MGESFDRDVGGDHLPEALESGNSAEYRTHFRINFVCVAVRNGLPWLFQKRI